MTQPPVGQLPPVTAVKRGNAFAVAGIVLGILIWPLGLLFSIIGLVKSKARAGSGQVLSLVGIVVSLVGAASSIPFAIFVFHSLAAGPPAPIQKEFGAVAAKHPRGRHPLT